MTKHALRAEAEASIRLHLMLHDDEPVTSCAMHGDEPYGLAMAHDADGNQVWWRCSEAQSGVWTPEAVSA